MTNIIPQVPSLAYRILDSFPSGNYALGSLLRLVDIVETERVPTAAVECRAQPRMLINPQFVAEHAPTSERLLMLVMHELHHVLLGHTRLLQRTTAVDNLVFDAVINAMLCRMFPQAEYTSLFTDLYSDRRFPECLLRPPTGFDTAKPPKIPPVLRERGRKRAADVYRSLYSEKGATYEELYDVLRELIQEWDAAAIVLIGDHGLEESSADGDLEGRSPVMFDAVRRIVEHWPQPPDPLRGRSLESLIRNVTLQPDRRVSNRGQLRKLLRRVAGVCGDGCKSRQWRTEPTSVQVPLPTFDRRSVVLRSLGVQPLLYNGEVPARRRVPAGERVHVYVDVSGSIGDFKSALYGALLDCREYVFPSVHLFSTTVVDVSFKDIRPGRCKSTYGTDILCVAEHIRSNRVRRAVLLTDGFVGRPEGLQAETLRRTRLGVALTPGESIRDDLDTFANCWVQLVSRDMTRENDTPDC